MRRPKIALTNQWIDGIEMQILNQILTLRFITYMYVSFRPGATGPAVQCNKHGDCVASIQPSATCHHCINDWMLTNAFKKDQCLLAASIKLIPVFLWAADQFIRVLWHDPFRMRQAWTFIRAQCMYSRSCIINPLVSSWLTTWICSGTPR